MSASVATSLGSRTQSRAPYAVTAPSEVVNPLGHLAPDRARLQERVGCCKRLQKRAWLLQQGVTGMCNSFLQPTLPGSHRNTNDRESAAGGGRSCAAIQAQPRLRR